MKIYRFFSISILALTILFSACNNNSPETDDNNYQDEDLQQPTTGIIDGVEYDNSVLRCWEITVHFSETISETTYSWSTEYSLVLWCNTLQHNRLLEGLQGDTLTITYTYRQTEADDAQSCISMLFDS